MCRKKQNIIMSGCFKKLTAELDKPAGTNIIVACPQFSAAFRKQRIAGGENHISYKTTLVPQYGSLCSH